MPIDKPEATAAVNTRRTFLARAAVGSALVATAGPLLGALPAAAQTDSGSAADSGVLDDIRYLVMADQIHAAAAIVYVEAATTAGLDGDARRAIAAFEAHHLEVVDRMDALKGSAASAVATVPDPTVLAVRDALGSGAEDVLRSLAQLENRIAATHLWAIGALGDPVTARAAAAAAASSGQRATVLGRLAGDSLAMLTPATVDDADDIGAALNAAEASIDGETPEPAEEPAEEPAAPEAESPNEDDDTDPEADTDE